jgi:hypothetical protein
VKVLFDHTIIQFGKIGEYGLEHEPKQPRQNYLATIVYRKQRERNDWLQKEIDCLPTIANFARQGRIKAFTTLELMAEDRVAEFPCSDDNVFADIEFEKALSPHIVGYQCLSSRRVEHAAASESSLPAARFPAILA